MIESKYKYWKHINQSIIRNTECYYELSIKLQSSADTPQALSRQNQLLWLIQPTLAMPSIWSKREMMCRNVTDRYHSWCNCLLRAPKLCFASAKSCFKSPILSVDSLNNRKIWWGMQSKQSKRREIIKFKVLHGWTLLYKLFPDYRSIIPKEVLHLEIIEAAIV